MRKSDTSANSNPASLRVIDTGHAEIEHIKAGPAAAARAPELDLNALVAAIAIHRDRGAFAHLYNWFAPRLTALGLQFGLGLDSASELTQETMVNVWRRAQTFDSQSSTLSTWVYTVMRDTRVELTGRRARSVEADDTADLLLDDHIVDALSRKPNSDALIGEMANLPTNHRRVAAKQLFENKSHNVIAEEFSVPLETIRLWSKQALERLRPALMEPVTQ